MTSFYAYLPSFLQKTSDYYFSSNEKNSANFPAQMDHFISYIKDKNNTNQIKTLTWKEKTKEFLKTQSTESCQLFLESLIQDSIQNNQEAVMFDWLSDVFTLEQLSKIAVDQSKIKSLQEEANVISAARRLAQKREECRFQNLPPLSSSKSVQDITGLFLKIIFYPLNPLCLFLDAISFSEVNKHYSTLWEKYLIVQVFTQGLLLAYYFGQFAIQSFLPTIATVTGPVGLVALVAFSVISTCIFIYYRWFRKPDDIAECENCERDWPLHDPIVPRKETDEIIATLNEGKIVALSGRSGEGKTAILRDLVKRAKNGELGKNYRKFFSVNLLRMITDGKFSFTESLNYIVEMAIKHNVCLIIDDVQYLYDRPGGPSAVKALFNKIGLSMIAVAPSEDWQRIKQSLLEEEQNENNKDVKTEEKNFKDASGFFKDNTLEVRLQDADDSILRNILWRVYHKSGTHLPIDQKAMDKIIERAKKGYLSDKKGLPTNAIALLEDLIRHCQVSFKPNFESHKLLELKLQYNNVTKESEKFEIEEKIAEARMELEKQKKEIKRVQEISRRHFEMQLKYMKLKPNLEKLTQKEKKWMHLTNFYGLEAFQQEILEKCKHKTCDLIINEALIENWDNLRASRAL